MNLLLSLAPRLLKRCAGHSAVAVVVRPFSSSSAVSTIAPVDDTPPPHWRRLDIAIVGLPNAGKSQLLNMLTGSTYAAVSRKRHTTRSPILGVRTIRTTENRQTTVTQLSFIDTPGFLKTKVAKKEGLDRELMTGAKRQIKHVDFTLIVIDAAANFTDRVEENASELMMEAINSEGRIGDAKNLPVVGPMPIAQKQKFAIVLNKVDLVHPKSKLMDLAEHVIGPMAEQLLTIKVNADGLNEGKPEDEIDNGIEEKVYEMFPTFFYTNALEEDEGVKDLLTFLTNKATPTINFELESDDVMEMNPLQRAQEIIREKMYRCLHREVPYSLRQRNLAFQYVPDRNVLVIHQDIMCQTKSHQRLVNGTGNRTIEKIRLTAARDIEKVLGVKVLLTLEARLVRSANQKWSI